MPNLTKYDNNQNLTVTKQKKKTPKNAELILADISSSMGIRLLENKTRFDLLCLALKPLAKSAHVLAFHDRVFEVDADNLPPPDHSTALHLALDKATQLEPLHVLVISDGEPDNESKAIESAKYLAEQCIIDVLYIGPATGNRTEQCIAFMKELATIGRGRYQSLDLDNPSGTLLLGSKVNSLLALPHLPHPDDAIKL